MNLFGGQMPAVPDQTSTIIGQAPILNGPKATLMLLTPREIPDQYKRAYSYQFGEGVRAALAERTQTQQRGMPLSHISHMLLDVPDARHAIMPTAQGVPLNLKGYSEHWTFVLIVDNDNTQGFAGINSIAPSRTLYFGYCVIEPATAKNLSASYVLNPMCTLQPTHRTQITVRSTLGYDGYQSYNVMGDVDIAPGSSLQQVRPQQEVAYDLSPDVLVNQTTPSYDLNPNLNPAPIINIAARPVNASPTLTFSTDLNAPNQHLAHLIGQAVATYSHLNADYAQSQMDMSVFQGGDMILSTYGTLLRSTCPTFMGQLSGDKTFTIGELLQYYPNLQWQVIEIPFKPAYDQNDNGAPTKQNVLISMLSASMPSILIQQGLAEVIFRYNSAQFREGAPRFIPEERGVFEVHGLSTLYECTEQEKVLKWQNMQQYLTTCIFPIVKQIAGEFDLMVHCSIGGVSLIQLNFLDNYHSQNGFVETNNLLGGLNTPLVGSMDEVRNNTGQLTTLVRDFAPTASGGVYGSYTL